MAIAFVNTGTQSGSGFGATSQAISLPASIVAGNLLIAYLHTQGSGTGTPGTHNWPVGWTKFGEHTFTNHFAVNDVRASFGWKIAVGGDSAPTVTWSGSAATDFWSAQFSGTHTVAPVGAISFNSGTGSPHSSSAFTATGAAAFAVYFDDGETNLGSTLLTQPSGWTQNATASSVSDMAIGSKALVNVGDSSGAISTAGSTSNWAEWQFELAASAPIGSSAATIPSIVASGVASTGNQSVKTLPSIIASGTGLGQVVGTSAATLLPWIPFGVGTGSLPGSTSDATFPSIVAAGVAVSGVVGTSMLSLLGIVASGTSYAPLVSANALPAFRAAGTAGTGVVGVSAATLLSPTVSGLAGTLAVGTSTVVLPSIQAASAGYLGTGATYSAIVIQTEMQGLSTYSNFQFNSLARFNGKTLAAGDSGLFTLDGDSDAGAQIAAVARVGTTDFGTSFRKRLERMYIGYRTLGKLTLRVYTDGIRVHDYLVPSNGQGGIHGTHVRLGRGLEARFWQFEIQNQAGADFSLHMIECKPTKLARRVGGRDA